MHPDDETSSMTMIGYSNLGGGAVCNDADIV
jgi:hypothetical protein